MRWIRRTFALFAIFCIVAWIGSQFWALTVTAPLNASGSYLEVTVVVGRIDIMTNHDSPLRPHGVEGWGAGITSVSSLDQQVQFLQQVGIPMSSLRDTPSFEWDSFSLAHPHQSWIWTGTKITFPLWLPALAFSLWPAISTGIWIKWRFFAAGTCHRCGYDLRGTPSGVCPECGYQASRQTGGA